MNIVPAFIALSPSLQDELTNKNAEINSYIIIIFSLIALIVVIIIGAIAWLYSHNQKMFRKFEELGRVDLLTQLLNRRAMTEEIDKELVRFKRNKKTFSLVIGDIDHFKTINDTYSQSCGDEILKSISRLLQERLRGMDKIARWSGQEFLLLLPETNQQDGALVAGKIRQIIEANEISWQGKTLNITMSFGVCEFAEDMELEQCFTKADQALYHAKEAGRNKVGTALD